MSAPTVLVMAKAPIAGYAKTRVAREVGDDVAADFAAAALLDTLRAVGGLEWPTTVALTGDLARAARSAELAAALRDHDVIPQRGASFADRLAAAHADADRGHGVVQIGMDTPHVTSGDLAEAASALGTSPGAIGPAGDGGWWLLALRDGAGARALTNVPMSRGDTFDRTIAAFDAQGTALHPLRRLDDVDTWDDAQAMASAHPRLAAARVVAAYEKARP